MPRAVRAPRRGTRRGDRRAARALPRRPADLDRELGRALRRVARSGDGWVASAFHCTPAAFAEQWARLQQLLADEGRDPDAFPNIVATLFFYVGADAERVVAERFAPLMEGAGRTYLHSVPRSAAPTRCASASRRSPTRARSRSTCGPPPIRSRRSKRWPKWR